MAYYNLNLDAVDLFDRTGLSQAGIARRSEITVFAMRDKVHKDQRTRGSTAWNIAKAYAAAAGLSEDAALDALFERLEDDDRKITAAPSLAGATTRF
jgi:hypothetical protein